jgi:16S rRNA (cytosine967-C5)-methyltransferase
MRINISPARTACYKLLCDIESRRLYSDDALNSERMLGLEIRDRHLTTEIVYGTLRWQALLDYVLSGASTRLWPKVHSGAKILLRMSLYQMWKMDRIPEYALVNDAVELAKRELGQGIDGYVNGILRNLTRTHPWKENDFLRRAPQWIQVSLPEWLYKRWCARFGEGAAQDFALSLNQPPQAAVRAFNETKNEAAFPFAVMNSDLVPGAFIKTDAADAGAEENLDPPTFQFQDEASQLIPHLLHPQWGWKIWDACAAPGGKTGILGKICGDSGRVIASDLRRERIVRLVQFLNNSGMHTTDVLVADARQPVPFLSCFDAVLADVPCSGLGTLRRNPEIKWQFQKQEFAGLQETQKRILHNVSSAVRVGGWLLYSTCSTEPEENEQVIKAFLDAHPGFCLQKPEYPPGIEKWTSRDSMVRTYPSKHLWDGFFASLMMRRS